MLRRLALIITTASLVFTPLFFASKVLAWAPGDPITTLDELNNATEGDGSLDKALKDFCKKRQGNQMNLETWYSGKCVDDTFSGEGVGFSDIVLLDLAEKVSGKKDPNKTFWTILNDTISGLKDISLSTPTEKQLALEGVRQKVFQSQNGGLTGQVGNLIGSLINTKPATTRSYVAYVSKNLQGHGIVSPALAAATQGVGFDTLSPFLTIWIAFRNLAYFGLVVFFIVYGFMMMFRVNLGQKTVISVQLAIPKLVITLLIITFSYAIVGLIYDIMWVVIAFIFGYLESQGIIVTHFPIWNLARVAGGNTWGGLVGSLILNALIAGPTAIFAFFNIILGGVGATLVGLATFLPGGIGSLVALIVAIAVLISYGKLFFKLIIAFITVVISLITGPLILLGNAFPGSKVIGTWIRGIVANLSVFPVTMLFLTFSYILMIQPLVGICVSSAGVIQGLLSKIGISFTGQAYCEALFGVKSLVANGNSGIYGIPLISTKLGMNTQGILALLGVGLLLMASKYVDIVRDALKVPPFKYGSDIAAALQAGRGIYSSGKEEIQKLAGTRGSGTTPPPSSSSPSTPPPSTPPTAPTPTTPPGAFPLPTGPGPSSSSPSPTP